MNRFFIDKGNIDEYENRVIIDEKEDIKHINKVLRLSIGDEIEICDNNSMEYLCEIKENDKEKIVCNIISKNISKGESNIEVVLFQGIPKSNKMDLIIQKCVELGIKRIVPILSDRCVVKINDRKSEDKKVERWNKISLEAAKQSKRGLIPIVDQVLYFDELAKHMDYFDLVVIPYEGEELHSLKKTIKENTGAQKIAIIIGPEGGFELEEVIKAQEWKARPVTLGPRILRTETAGFTTLSILLYELGDLGGK